MSDSVPAGEELTRSRLRLQAVFDNALDAVLLADDEARYADANPAACRLLGYTREELLQLRVFDITPPPDAAAGWAAWTAFLRDGQQQGEYTIRRRDGTVAVVEFRAVANVQPGLHLSVLRDATERHEVERRVRDAEQRFRALVMATSDVVYRMSADWTEMQPLDGRGLVASNDEPIRGWMEQNIPADEHGRVRAAIARAVATRSLFELEHQVVRPDGSIGWTSSRAVPILGPDGEVAEWFGAATDITARKRAESELARVTAEAERQRRLYETALSNNADFNYTFGLDGRFTFVNRALLDLWGKRSDEAIGKDFFDLGYPPELAAKLQRQIRQVIETRQPVRDETPYTAASGTREYEYILVPVTGASGVVEAVAGSTRDITDRKAVERTLQEQADRLREADRRKDEFLAMLAHELRNPLAPIRNAAQVLRLSAAAEPAVQRSSIVIERQVQAMTRLVDDLLDVSRITTGKVKLRREPVELADVVARAVETARPLIDSRRHELAVGLPAEPVPLEADAARLAQVVSNLLINAAKYTREGGHIRLTVEREPAAAVVRVRDSGVGIPADMLGSVFNLFTQVDRSLARSEGGLGIGLTLVKNLVQMHGGTVEAHSDGAGRGSEFVVRLPVARAHLPADAAHERPPAPEPPPRRVLVVDDNTDAALSLAMLLRLGGHDVRTAHDGPAAVEEADAFRPHVAFIDIGLPGMDGYEVARHLRRRAGTQDACLVALTGYGQDGDRQRSREAGFDDHLVKPADPGALHAVLAALKET